MVGSLNMAQLILLIVYGAILIAAAAVGPVVTYFLNQRALDHQTTVLANGQRQIAAQVKEARELVVTKVEATHDLVNGTAEMLRKETHARGVTEGIAEEKARNGDSHK